MDEKDEIKVGVYHEKQMKELCAMHALNNLFQDKNAFTTKDLDEICTRLSPSSFINPHRSLLGFGNYDVNVIMAALQKKGYDTIWFDKRKNIDCLQVENIMGYILNIPTGYKWGFVRLPIHRKHWISLRKVENDYMNLDSKLDCPEIIGDGAALKEFLREQLEDCDKELLLVVTPDVGEFGTWKIQAPTFVPPLASEENTDESTGSQFINVNGINNYIKTQENSIGKHQQ